MDGIEKFRPFQPWSPIRLTGHHLKLADGEEVVGHDDGDVAAYDWLGAFVRHSGAVSDGGDRHAFGALARPRHLGVHVHGEVSQAVTCNQTVVSLSQPFPFYSQ